VNIFERRAVMKRIILVLRITLVLSMPVVFGASLEVSAQEDRKNRVTVEGEVVDMYCYMTRHQGEGRGARHASCANTCLRKGGTVGFVSNNGELYVLMSNTSAPINKRVAGLGGKKVKITGIEVERDDVEAIRVQRIERIR
jgi:hypothetical protein